MHLLVSQPFNGMVESRVRWTTKVGLSYKMSDFTGTPVSETDLIGFLTQIRRSEMVRLIANMTATVSRDEWRTPAGQLEMARNVLPEDVWARVKTKIASPDQLRGALFHRRQLWFLLQMAVMVCVEDSPKLDPMEMQRRAAVAALMASDVLDQVDRAHTPEVWGDQGFDQWAATTLLSLRDQRPGGHILGRSICMWLDMQSDPVVKKKMKQIGLAKTLDESFAAVHGLSLREFICILMTAYSVYEVGMEETPPQIPLLDPGVMSGMPYSLESAAKAISLAGIASDAFVTRRESWARDFSALYCKPLLEVLPGKYACADVGLFTLFFMDGVFDLLEECLSKKKFRDLFGTIFEQYINRVFSDFLYSGTDLVRQFAPSPKYVGENRQAADGIALLSGLTVLMEYKGGMLTKRQKYGGNIEETIKGLDGLLARFGTGKKGLGQLVENIERLLRGDKIHINNIQIDIPADSKIIPTLVVYDDSLGLHAIRNHVDHLFQSVVKERSLPKNRIGPVVILTTRDVESLQVFSTASDVATIFADYCDHVVRSPGDMAGSFHGFLQKKYANARPNRSFTLTRLENYRKELLDLLEANCTTREESANSGQA